MHKRNILDEIGKRNDFNRAIKTEIRKGASLRKLQRVSRDLGVGVSQKSLTKFMHAGLSRHQVDSWIKTRGKVYSSFKIPQDFTSSFSDTERIHLFEFQARDKTSGKKIWRTMSVTAPSNTTQKKLFELADEQLDELLDEEYPNIDHIYKIQYSSRGGRYD